MTFIWPPFDLEVTIFQLTSDSLVSNCFSRNGENELRKNWITKTIWIRIKNKQLCLNFKPFQYCVGWKVFCVGESIRKDFWSNREIIRISNSILSRFLFYQNPQKINGVKSKVFTTSQSIETLKILDFGQVEVECVLGVKFFNQIPADTWNRVNVSVWFRIIDFTATHSINQDEVQEKWWRGTLEFRKRYTREDSMTKHLIELRYSGSLCDIDTGRV